MSRFLLVAVLAFAFAACSSETGPSPAPESAAAAPDSTAPPAEGRLEDGAQVVRVEAGPGGFVPARIALTAGIPARLVVTRTVGETCATEISVPAYGVAKTDLPLNEPVAIEFTPTEAGEVEFVCGMNMQRGTILVTS